MPASNTYIILKALGQTDMTTRELSSITGLTPKAVGHICYSLSASGLVDEHDGVWHKRIPECIPK